MHGRYPVIEFNTESEGFINDLVRFIMFKSEAQPSALDRLKPEFNTPHYDTNYDATLYKEC